MTGIAEQVAKGAALLDAKDPGWWRADAEPAIYLPSLKLASKCRCPLGQRFGDYNDGLRALGLASLEDEAACGFLSRQPGLSGWDELTAEWKRVITERRAAQ